MDEYSKVIINAVDNIKEAVIQIEVYKKSRGRLRVAGSGSGFIFSSDGFAFTNRNFGFGVFNGML